MPSTQTRTKLKAFQFIEGAPVEAAKGREAEKENLVRTVEDVSMHRGTMKASNASKEAAKPAVTPKLATSKSCPPPSTPSMKRLPLADLVGNIDDSSRHAPQPIVSPEEQLVWRGSQPVNTPIPRNNRKRARSSSPAAPSQEDHTLDSIRKELTTPQADPVMELWSRYTSTKGTPSANKSVAFAHLINEASPRSTVSAGSVSGLRRWASCGHEFPASNRKRRRTYGVFQDKDHPEDVFEGAASSDGAVLGQPKSNIASMVQRMKESVSKSQPRISSQLPSSSSPLPDTGDRHAESSGSPLQRRAPPEIMEGEFEAADITLGETEAPQACAASSSDEFGDDDFDSDMVDALDISQHEHEHEHEQNLQPSKVIQPPHEPQPQPMNLESEDDFGMGDDEDDFAADLEQVASLYDTQLVAAPSAPSPAIEADPDASTRTSAPVPVIDLASDDSDEFGDDDIDIDEFAAAEVAATQTPANNVRRNIIPMIMKRS